MTFFLGKIMIGNKNISDLNLRTLRRGITVIPQEPMLISESIRYVTVKILLLIVFSRENLKSAKIHNYEQVVRYQQRQITL